MHARGRFTGDDIKRKDNIRAPPLLSKKNNGVNSSGKNKGKGLTREPVYLLHTNIFSRIYIFSTCRLYDSRLKVFIIANYYS